MRESTQQILEGNWRQFRGAVQEKWGNLTNDDLDQVEGKYEKLVGTIQERTGKERREIEQVLDELVKDAKRRP